MIESGAPLGLEIVFQIFGGVTVLFASWKLFGYIRVHGIEPSAPQICLALEIIGSIGTIRFSQANKFFLERIIYMVDPVWIEGIYDNSTGFALLALTYMFSLMTTLLLGLYWRKSLSSLSKENMFTRVRKPLAIGFAFIIVTSILYILGSVFISAVIFFIIYNFIITPIILIFFLVSGFRILVVLRTNNAIRASKKGSLQKVVNNKGMVLKFFFKLTGYIITSTVVFFIFLIASIVFITTSYNGPWGFYALLWFLFGSLYTVSFLHVMAFVNPYGKKSSSETEVPVQNSISMMSIREENSVQYQDNKEV